MMKMAVKRETGAAWPPSDPREAPLYFPPGAPG